MSLLRRLGLKDQPSARQILIGFLTHGDMIAYPVQPEAQWEMMGFGWEGWLLPMVGASDMIGNGPFIWRVRGRGIWVESLWRMGGVLLRVQEPWKPRGYQVMMRNIHAGFLHDRTSVCFSCMLDMWDPFQHGSNQCSSFCIPHKGHCMPSPCQAFPPGVVAATDEEQVWPPLLVPFDSQTVFTAVLGSPAPLSCCVQGGGHHPVPSSSLRLSPSFSSSPHSRQ